MITKLIIPHPSSKSSNQSKTVDTVKHTLVKKNKKTNESTEAADENVKHRAQKQRQRWKQLRHKNKGVSARKEEKDTVSWKHEPPSPSLWNNLQSGPLPITRGTALCLPVHFWHRGTPNTCSTTVCFHGRAKGI